MTDVHDLTDDNVIARMRTALDEVAAGAGLDDIDVIPLRTHSGMPRRWMGIAAATILLAGGAVFALTQRDTDESNGAAAEPTIPVETAVPKATGRADLWYTLTAPGLGAGDVEAQPVLDGPPNPVVTWIATTGINDGLLVVTQYFDGELGAPRSDDAETVINAADGSQWQFRSYGMTLERREQLAAQVVPGSGLPFVLPDPSMQLLSVGDLGPAQGIRTQTYRSDDDFAVIGVGTDRGLGRALALSAQITETSIDGFEAYRSIQAGDGSVIFVWSYEPGMWAQLSISPGLADRADEIAASVVRTPMPAPDQAADGETVPAEVPPSTTMSPAETTIAAATTPPVVEADAPWFALDMPGAVAGDITQTPFQSDTPILYQSWVTGSGDDRGFLAVTIETGMSPGIEGDYTVEEIPVANSTVYFLRPNRDDAPLDYGFELRWFHDDGTAWLFQSQGLDRDALVAAALSATPTTDGHITIADLAFEQLTSGSSEDGPITSQSYTHDGGLIQLSVERNGSAFQQLASSANIIDVTVAGVPGYAALLGNNQVTATWDTGNGWWGHLNIQSTLSREADGIIEAVVPANLPTG